MSEPQPEDVIWPVGPGTIFGVLTPDGFIPIDGTERCFTPGDVVRYQCPDCGWTLQITINDQPFALAERESVPVHQIRSLPELIALVADGATKHAIQSSDRFEYLIRSHLASKHRSDTALIDAWKGMATP